MRSFSSSSRNDYEWVYFSPLVDTFGLIVYCFLWESIISLCEFNKLYYDIVF